MTTVIIQVASLLLLLALGRSLALRGSPPELERPLFDGLVALGLVAVGLLAVGFSVAETLRATPDASGSATAISEVSDQEEPSAGSNPGWFNPKWEGWTVDDLLEQSGIYLLQFCPVLIILALRRQGAKSLGLSRRNLGKAALIGIVLGSLSILAYGDHLLGRFPAFVAGRSEPYVFLFAMMIVGVVEEATFRGFIQLRLVAWLGALSGISITVAFFALIHVPFQLRYRDPASADFWLALGFHGLSGLVYSLVMNRTQHLAAPAIMHALANWAR